MYNPFLGSGGTPETVRYAIEKIENSNPDYAAQYRLKQTINGNITYSGTIINIPKDIFVESGDLKTCETADVPVEGYAVGNKYLDLVLANSNNDHIYILVTDLIELTASNIEYDNESSELLSINVQDAIDELNSTKVTVIEGKGLSTNDYSTLEKNKLAGIESGAQVNVQADWDETNSTANTFIKNKPIIPSLSSYYNKTETNLLLNGKVDVVDGKQLSTNDYTDEEKEKLQNIAAGFASGVCPLDSSGLVPVANIPPTVIERIVTVADDTARFALTTADVQDGDTVKVLSNSIGTNIMYLVLDDTNLDSEAGYQVYSAGTAAQAEKLTTARSIFGQSFNGTTNIDYPEVYGNLYTAGWYRVFTNNHMTTYSASLVFAINTTYNNNPASSAIIIVNEGTSSPAITTICSSYTSVIPKVRAVWRSGYVCYIDIYYNVSVSNRVKITQLASAGSFSHDWTMSSTLSVAPEVLSGYSVNEQSLYSNAITATNFNAKNFVGSGAGLTGVTSAQVSYSNTSSGMAAETAQAALDELCTVSARTSVTALMIPHGRSAILTMPTVPVCCGEIATASNSSENVCSTHLFYGLRTATPKLTTIDSCTLIAVAASAGAITITNSATTVDAYCYIAHKTSAHATIELVPEGGA